MRNAYLIHGDGSATVFAWHHGSPWTFIVDEADLPLLTGRVWHVSRADGTHYVLAYLGQRPCRRHTLLHRLMLAAQRGAPVDHQNYDGLDNRRENLRVASPTENGLNRRGAATTNRSSGVLGVYWMSADRLWRARVQVDGRRVSLGCYRSKSDAARATLTARMILGVPGAVRDFNRLRLRKAA